MGSKFTMFFSKTISKQKYNTTPINFKEGRIAKMSVIHKTAVCKVNISLK